MCLAPVGNVADQKCEIAQAGSVIGLTIEQFFSSRDLSGPAEQFFIWIFRPGKLKIRLISYVDYFSEKKTRIRCL